MVASVPRRHALICGISGQDGAYLAQLLLNKGYEVSGTSRKAESHGFVGLKALGIRHCIKLYSMQPGDFQDVRNLIEQVQPHEIYNLAGQSSVGLSFEQPLQAIESISRGVLNLLETIRVLDPTIRLFNAGSGECFGDTGNHAADESSCFRPRSPYAAAKAAASWQVSVYRESYGLFACNGILFNHESPLRSERFVTQKIVAAARRIADGSKERLQLGNLNIRRDWGWAPEYVEAMWRVLNYSVPEDFVIATGVTQSLQDFIAAVFEEAGLSWSDHVVTDSGLLRPTDPAESSANPRKIAQLLSWTPKIVGSNVAREMFRAESSEAKNFSTE